jgi:hypothetical protein
MVGSIPTVLFRDWCNACSGGKSPLSLYGVSALRRTRGVGDGTLAPRSSKQRGEALVK